jgi:hypothetical protein
MGLDFRPKWQTKRLPKKDSFWITVAGPGPPGPQSGLEQESRAPPRGEERNDKHRHKSLWRSSAG